MARAEPAGKRVPAGFLFILSSFQANRSFGATESATNRANNQFRPGAVLLIRIARVRIQPDGSGADIVEPTTCVTGRDVRTRGWVAGDNFDLSGPSERILRKLHQIRTTCARWIYGPIDSRLTDQRRQRLSRRVKGGKPSIMLRFINLDD